MTSENVRHRKHLCLGSVLGVAGLALAVQTFGLPHSLGSVALAAEVSKKLPRPALDTAASSEDVAVAVVAGGCFWGVQGVFQHLKGVKRAVSGYAGGTAETADYDAVSMGTTRHTEAVSITYDPRTISYGEILRVFFSVALDPTEIDRQGPDHGPQYRSAIFAQTGEQAKVARAYIAQLDAAKTYSRPIATTVEATMPFYPAEAYHQDFLARHPNHPYIVVNDKPKVQDLKRFFPERFANDPVLVNAPPA